jgi:hypothetical protein
MSADQVLTWMMIIAASACGLLAAPVVVIAFVYRRELDWKYVLLGIRAPRSTGETESQ